MKKGFIIISSIILLFAAGLTSCQTKSTPAAEIKSTGSLKVLAAESFIADMAQNVAGDRTKVDTLMPLGIDPHAFEPVPGDVVKIADSQVLIINGAGFEEWLDKVIKNAGGEHLIVEASSGLTGREAREGEEAMLSEDEKAEQICSPLDGKLVDEKVSASDKPETATPLHDETGETAPHEHTVEIITVGLNPIESNFGGYIQVDVEEDGDFIIASETGSISILDLDGKEAEIEALFH